MSAIRLIIRGRVQGVGYRWWAVRTARRLRLDGWVRNRSDGSVELAAYGPDEALEALIQACGQGPDTAAVSSVERVEALDPPAPGSGFHDRPTV